MDKSFINLDYLQDDFINIDLSASDMTNIVDDLSASLVDEHVLTRVGEMYLDLDFNLDDDNVVFLPNLCIDNENEMELN